MRRLRGARFVSDFDSSVNMVRALGSFFRGEDHRAMSTGPGSSRLARAVTAPPRPVRRLAFIGMGAAQGVPLDRVRDISIDDIDHWVVRQYGPGPYPVVMVGSASGAAVHLAAALRAPFLPQTTMSPVRDLATYPDDIVGSMEALAPTARFLAARNPRVAVYHMHDPAQDRPMLQGMAYMRLKRRSLGRAYERFLEERLAPGGVVLQVECTRDWRTRKVGERAYFQHGCLGGVPEEEYHESGPRIAEYLEREGSPYRRWDPPEMDARRPEAEWGFDPALGEDVARLADRFGYRVRRLVTTEPQELSPFVADFHRWWYRRRGLPDGHLLAESYVQWDPTWMLRLGAVPFWNRFNMEPSFEEFERYLDTVPAYDRIHVNLFSQGLWSPGVVPVHRWRELAASRARETGDVIGVDEHAYPADTGATLRYQPAFESLPARQPMPAPLPVSEIDRFLDETDTTYRMAWT
jgi:hypothetical protein